MKLGEFLSNAGGSMAPVKHVRFRAIGRTPSGPQLVSAEVEASMIFVSESDRQLAIRDANKEIRSLYGDDPVPGGRLDDEITYQFLFRCLRDSQSDSYIAPFAESTKGLKNALVLKTANDLWAQYHDWVAEEFPDTIDKEDFEKLVKEAEGKSFAALLSEFGFSTIHRALPSLAARLGK